MKLKFLIVALCCSWGVNAQNMRQILQPELNTDETRDTYKKQKVKTVEVSVTDKSEKNRRIIKEEVDKSGRVAHSQSLDYTDARGDMIYAYSDDFYGYGEGNDDLPDTIFHRPEDFMGRSWFGNEYYTWFTYDDKGRLVKRQRGKYIDEYKYNAEGLLQREINLDANDTMWKHEYKFNKDSGYYVATSEGILVRFTADGKVAYRENSSVMWGGSLMAYSYTYDKNGLVTKEERNDAGTKTFTTYTYSKKCLIEQAVVTDEKGNILYTMNYAYTFY